jgi:hypothetical protein
VGNVSVGPQISLEAQTYTHGIAPGLSRIDRGADGATQLKLVGFYGHDLNQGHFFDQLFRPLNVQTVFFCVPASTFNVDSLNVGALVYTLGDL